MQAEELHYEQIDEDAPKSKELQAEHLHATV